ncbi:MAG: ABC transporter ATP-binding protein [Bdellovibrionales bacterium CG12_big_fil_rev_8_21_14_0_65_38_15]|nr:MAG: ABC transporter ATP-binding protein [Bdellovibrionales bacterium CG12_big_fil_rev_8_21_14_0_65_38_15]
METILNLNNIHKSFGEKRIHQGVNFELHKGESLGLLGGSGTGKSVLLRSIIGLEKIDSGKILFHDKEVQGFTDELNLSKLRLKISYSFQSGALFDSLNVFDNIAYPLFEHTKLSYVEIQVKVAQVLKLIDLEGIENLMPSDLSGGMQKRVGMARAMILDPEIILYDEPTAGLDPANIENVVSLMLKLKERGQSSILVTHDIPAAIRFCDRILILIDRKIYFNGTVEEFTESDDPNILKFAQGQAKEAHHAS